MDGNKTEAEQAGSRFGTAGASREQTIVRTSAIGIAANVLLAAFKAVVGLVSNSIAVVLDAVNNLSDALSSVVTIVGAKLAARQPDKKHPLGYGRIEYMSAAVVAAIVLYAGITSLVESIKKIISPETPDYSVTALVIIAAAVVVKIVLGRYVKSVGERVHSDSLVASGKDALFDAILSASVLAAAVVYLTTGVSLEAWVGAVISLFIIKAGLEMLRDTVDDLLGTRVTKELSQQIKGIVAEEPKVLGVYDLVLNSLGPDRQVGSIHVEVPDTMNAIEIDAMSRRIERAVYDKTDGEVAIAAVGVYAHNTSDSAESVHKRVRDIALAHPEVIEVHGFYLDEKTNTVTFDVIVSYDVKNRAEVYEAVCREVKQALPDYKFEVQLDADVAD